MIVFALSLKGSFFVSTLYQEKRILLYKESVISIRRSQKINIEELHKKGQRKFFDKMLSQVSLHISHLCQT